MVRKKRINYLVKDGLDNTCYFRYQTDKHFCISLHINPHFPRLTMTNPITCNYKLKTPLIWVVTTLHPPKTVKKKDKKGVERKDGVQIMSVKPHRIERIG